MKTKGKGRTAQWVRQESDNYTLGADLEENVEDGEDVEVRACRGVTDSRAVAFAWGLF